MGETLSNLLAQDGGRLTMGLKGVLKKSKTMGVATFTPLWAKESMRNGEFQNLWKLS